MTPRTNRTRPRVAISLEMNWGFTRHQDAYAGCHAYAEKVGWDCFIHPAPEQLLDGRSTPPVCDGIIARTGPELARAAREAGVPLVNIWMNCPAKEVPSVFPDNRMAGAMAARHLLGRGFRNFGFLGYEKYRGSADHYAGFSETVGIHNLPCSAHRFPIEDLSDDGTRWDRFTGGLERWIDSWETPIGIFANQDLLCRYLMDVLHGKGLHVSQDVALVGCDNDPIICGAPLPSLTSIDIGYSRIGYRAAELLDHLMAGGEPPQEPVLLSPGELIPRQSTDVFAANDPIVSRALRFISENSHERIEVKNVVSAVATNRRSLELRFRESIGNSIATEITRLRLERAKRRLIETDHPMKYVAVESGFRNADHFCKVFARVEGISPSRFREERRNIF